MSKAAEAGKSLADLILAKLPESLRAGVQSALSAPEASDAITFLGESALARSDYSKNMDDLKKKADEIESTRTQLQTDYDNLNNWYATKKSDLDDYAKLKANPPKLDDKPIPSVVDPSKFVARDEFDKIMNQEQMSAAMVMSTMNTLSLKHFQDFGEVLDMQAILQDKNLGKPQADGRRYGLIEAYQSKFQDKLSERDKLAEEKRINKLVEDRLAVERKQQQQQPFPIRGGQGSPLDALEASADQKSQFSADAAAAEYQRLQEVRSASA